MYQNYNYYPTQQNYMRQAPPQMILKGRPVASLEEVRATPIDFDGSIFYFPDMANRRIYTKQINIDGTATLYVYELKELPKEKSEDAPSIEKFVTRDEFEKVISELRKLGQPIAESTPPQKTELLPF